MPELVGMLSHVNHINFVVCHFMCTTWMHTTSPCQQQEQEDWSEQVAAKGRPSRGAPVGLGQWLPMRHGDVCISSCGRPS
jgi:hypothetical protein